MGEKGAEIQKMNARNGRKLSLGNSSQSTLCRKSHIVKFFDSSSEDESLSVEAKTAIRRRRRTRESVDRLGMMVPLEGDPADCKSVPYRPVPLLPKPALTTLHVADIKKVQNVELDTTEKNSEKSKTISASAIIPEIRPRNASIESSSKSVTFDFVEVMEFSENDIEDVPDGLCIEDASELLNEKFSRLKNVP